MAEYSSVDDFIRTELDRYANAVSDALRQLLETKHLYQSVAAPIIYQGTGKKTDEYRFEAHVASLEAGPWYVEDPSGTGRSVALRALAMESDPAVVVRPPDVKLFCRTGTCGRVEPFNLVTAEDVLSRESRTSGAVQIFALAYRCQSCKGTPEVLLVRREGQRLTLSGRSPIEHVEVPAVIPKEVKRFYGGAIVAHQSGQTLAGNFMLRTLIEQWARQSTALTGFVDTVLEAYVGSLPPDFRSRFPVLRETYSELSVDLHSATGAEAAFDKARAEIVRHFEARRLFGI